MVYDKEIEEYEAWKGSQEKPWNRFIKNLKPGHYILIVILIGFMILLVKNKMSTDKNTILIIGGMAVAIIIFLTLKSREGKMISREQAMLIVKNKLEADIGSVYTTGTRIELTGYCALRYWGRDNPYKWEVGVNIIHPNSLIEEIMVALNPFSGEIMKLMATPAGWDATEAPDLKPVYPFEYYKEPPEAYPGEGGGG